MPISGSDILLYEKKDKIVTMTLNRPERLNSLSLELIERLDEAFIRFRDDNDAWVAIITGAGDRAFCAGLDLKEQAERQTVSEYQVTPEPCHVDVWKPLIAAINGYAIAGGWWLANKCDIRIAAEHAQMGIAETMWNLDTAWIVQLAHKMLLGHALEVVLWGDTRITAQRAYEIGWVNRVVPMDKLMEEAMSWAERMVHLGPRSVRDAKEILYRGSYLPPSEGLAFGTALCTNLVGMEDTIEGPRAFAEGRKPEYKNK